jgi:hypothetical protein
MPASSDPPVLTTFAGGFTADWSVVVTLLDLESRGVRFELVEGGRFRVMTLSVLTPADRAFLTAPRRASRDRALLQQRGAAVSGATGT